MSKEMWNARYNADEYVYGKKPNEFFKAELDKIKPGRLLLPAEGEGRNGVYAAAAGWDVRAFDQSEEGRKKAMALAMDAGVSFRYDLSDLAEVDLPKEWFDVIALIFVHQLPGPRRAFHRKLFHALKPGGMIILEAFSKSQLKFFSGGPKDPDLLFSTADLADDFSDLTILMNQELLVVHDEGTFHSGEASVVRLAAGKKI